MAGETMLSRPGTSLRGGGPGGVRNLPVIEHPMARLDRDNLKVSGGHLAMPLRQGTYVSIANGQVMADMEDANLPRLRSASYSSSCSDWTGRSLTMEIGTLEALIGGTRHIPSRIATPPEYSPKVGRWEANAGFSTEELLYLIMDRLETGFHGIEHLFKANDSSGKGVISREALLKIIYTICGYVSPEQFNKLLRSIGLNGKTNTSFDEFVQCFRSTKTSSKVWLSPAHRVAMFSPRRPDGGLSYRNGAISAAFCHNLLRDRARAGNFRVREVLPEACFAPGGVVISPQLHDMLTYLGYRLTHSEFTKLWHRFDTNASGVLPTAVFLKRLGLDENGYVRPSTAPQPAYVQTLRLDPHKPRPHTKEDKENKKITRQSLTEEPLKKTRRIIKKAPSTTLRLDRITQCLHLKFEEQYHLLLQGMQMFDFLKDGFMSRMDFKRVLEEFGLHISTIDLEYFLSRCGVRTINGQIIYKELLLKFFNRAEYGLVHRVITNSPHLFGEVLLPPLDPSSTLTVEQMEVRLVDLLHSSFLGLMTSFRKHDRYNIGVVTRYELRALIEQLLGYPMEERQYEELLSETKLDSDGLVPYTAFMEAFNKPPGSWNQRQVAGHLVTVVRQEATPAEVRGLKAEAEGQLAAARAEVLAEEAEAGRNLRASRGMEAQELIERLAGLFRTKFHSFDKAFRSIDRHMTGRLSVHQFADMLKQCDLVLMKAEVDRLWETLPTSSDNMLSMSALIRHVSALNGGIPHTVNTPATEDTSDMAAHAQLDIRDQSEAGQTGQGQLAEQLAIRVEVRRILSKDTVQVMERLRPEITQHWDGLKQALRRLDPAGRALVAAADMTEVLRGLQFAVSEPETDLLLHAFIAQGTGLSVSIVLRIAHTE